MKRFNEFIYENKWLLTIDCSSKWNMLQSMEENDEFEYDGDLENAIIEFCDFINHEFSSKKTQIIKLTNEDIWMNLQSLLRDINNIKKNNYELLDEFYEEFNQIWNNIYNLADKNKIWIKTIF